MWNFYMLAVPFVVTLSALWQVTPSKPLAIIVAFGAAVGMTGVAALVRSYARGRLRNIEPRLAEVTEALRQPDLSAQDRTNLTKEWANLMERRNRARERLNE